MDDFIKLTGLPTFTFLVGDHKFEVASKNRSGAMQVANTELWGLLSEAATPGKFSCWFDHPTAPNTYVWRAE
jgi:hypothetical protein